MQNKIQPDTKSKSFLFRFRAKDTPTGISNETFEKLIRETGLNQTELTHLALKEMAYKYLPLYEQDDGPLTSQQIEKIKTLSTATDIPEERYSNALF